MAERFAQIRTAILTQMFNPAPLAIAPQGTAGTINKGASSKDASDHPDDDVSIGQHHSAIKSHQAVLGKLDRAHKNALAAKDHDAASWISKAKDTHTMHRDWNMKMARNRRFKGAPPQAQRPGRAAQAPTAQRPATGQAQRPGMAQKPMAGRGTVNTKTGQRLGAFNPKTGQRMGSAPMGAGAAAMASVTGHAPAGHAPAARPQGQPMRPAAGGWARPQAPAAAQGGMRAGYGSPNQQPAKARKKKTAMGESLDYTALLEALCEE